MQTSIKAQVRKFWAWFEGNHSKVKELFRAGEKEKALDLLHEHLSPAGDGCGMEMGIDSGDRLEITVTAEEDHLLKYFTRYWKEGAPATLQNCCIFNSVKPPCADADRMSIRIGGKDYSGDDFLIHPTENHENSCYDIEVFSKAFKHLEEDACFRVLFIMLDLYLGEVDTSTRTGRISVIKKPKGNGGLTFSQFAKLIKTSAKEKGWNTFSDLTEMYMMYRREPNDIGLLREDIYIGMTSFKPVMGWGEEGDAEIISEIERMGGELGYTYFLNGAMEDEKLLEVRYSLEEAFDAALKDNRMGYCTGGATGTEHCYMDLILFEKEGIEEIVKGLGKRAGIELAYRAFGTAETIRN